MRTICCPVTARNATADSVCISATSPDNFLKFYTVSRLRKANL